MQVPLVYVEGSTFLKHSKLSRTVFQPAGRMVAQQGHAVSLARLDMVRGWLLTTTDLTVFKNREFWEGFTRPITTIVKSTRDSYELYHVLRLLAKANIEVYEFYDENEDYGTERPLTAFATRVVEPKEVYGILDYLPLWSPRCTLE